MEPASAFCHSATATLCVSVDLCCESYLALSVFTSTQNKLHDGYKCNKTSTWARANHITGCVFLSAEDKHSLCVVCLRAEQAESALEGARCHCVCSLSEAFFEKGAFTCVPRGAGAGPAFAKKKGGVVAALVGIADGSGGGNEDG